MGLLLLCAAVLAALPAFAQVATSGSILGEIKDPSAATIPAASVVCISSDTGTRTETVSTASGVYRCANLVGGLYRVEVTAAGFTKGVVNNVKVDVGQPTNLDVSLEVGLTGQTVEVQADATPIVTSTSSVTQTVTGRQITELPLSTRSALDLAFQMPGAAGGGGVRYSSVNGLPHGSLNVTLDGMNVQDNTLKSGSGGSFYTYIQPRIDAVDEVTVSSAANSASTGEGAVQITFVSKRGTNEWRGLLFEYVRNDALNANTWFNNRARQPRQVLKLNQFGGNIGGPIKKNKLFIFAYWDEFRLPNSIVRNRTVLKSGAVNGDFTYRGSDGVTRTVNVLQVAGANGFRSSPDQNIRALLTKIDGLRSTGVGITTQDLFRDTMTFNNAGSQRRFFPTTRLDWNASPKLSIESTWWYQGFRSSPDTLNSYDRSYPGFETLNGRPAEGSQDSNRFLLQTAVRAVLTPAMSNEFRIGVSSGTVVFAGGMDGGLYPNNTRLGFPLGLTSPLNLPRDSRRNTPVWQMSDTLGWQKGRHTMSFGWAFTRISTWDSSLGTSVPLASLGVTGTDTANTIFNTTNFPGLSNADQGNAINLYALLTGRLSGVAGVVNVDENSKKYVQYAPLVRRELQKQMGFFFTDTFRLSSSLTVNYGLRWDFQGVPTATNGIYTQPEGGYAGLFGESGVDNVFKPGTFAGKPTNYVTAGQGYNNSWANFAPSGGFAWAPNSDNKMIKGIFGKGGAFRAGYGISYNREGMNNFRALVGANPGPTASAALVADRDFRAGSLFYDGSLPPLVTLPQSFAFPLPLSTFTYTGSASLNWYAPDLVPPRVHSWSMGIQREIFKSTVLEVRYVGNWAQNLWRQYNINEVNIFENGFLNEFQVAQNNLAVCQANLAACGGTARFDNRGLAGQAATPIMTAAFSGLAAGSGFASSTFITNLQQGTAGGMANSLAVSPTFMPNIIKGGFPSNLFFANPGAAGGGSYLTKNGAFSTYNSIQIELRRRMSQGLLVSTSYVISKGLTNYFSDDSSSFANPTTQRDFGLNKGISPYDIRHVFKANWLYELPFGPNKKWLNGGNGVVGRILGGWQINGIARLQTGQPFLLTSGRATFNQFDSGVIPMVSRSELQSKMQVIKNPNGTVQFLAPELIGSDGRANPAYLQVPTRPGQLGYNLFLYGPKLIRLDTTIAKNTRITERLGLEIRAEILNVINASNFMQASPSSSTSTLSIQSTTFGQTTQYYQDFNGSQDPGGRVVQLVARFRF
jgi:hypothetical protein